jgi:hypothetical protein
MKIFVPSYQRSQTATTPVLLEKAGFDFILVLRPSQVAAYRHFQSRHCKIAVMDTEESINAAREACRSLLAHGEWCLQMDDNIRAFTAAKQHVYDAGKALWESGQPNPVPGDRRKFARLLDVPVGFTEFYKRVVVDCVRESETRGSNVCAFSAFENPWFRFKKWHDVAYTQNKCVLLRNVGMSWDQSNGFPAMEEYALLAAHLLRDGRVLVNKWARPIAKHYEQGGIGPYKERLPAKRTACEDIMTRFPGLFRQHKDGELLLRWNSVEQVERWREDLTTLGSIPHVTCDA